MIGDYYSEGFDKEHNYGEEITICPKTTLFIPVKGNLRATIKSERLNLEDRAWVAASDESRGPPPLFWKENLIPSDKGLYIFETKYVRFFEFADILPIKYLNQIPKKLRKEFLQKVPKEIYTLAKKLVGNETDTKKILFKFYNFICEHIQAEVPTTGKSLQQLLDEYNKTSFFHGNCKEARDFYMALCDSFGYPTKRVYGKSLDQGGHVWADVFIPVNKGYKLLPIDAALGYFGYPDQLNHLFIELTPSTCTKLFQILKSTKKEYKLKIERID